MSVDVVRFSLPSSPFSNIFKFSLDELAGYLEPHFHAFISQAIAEKGKPIPPGAFLFSESDGCYLSSYNYDSPPEFHAALSSCSAELGTKLAVMFSVVGAIAALGGSSAYLLLYMQTPGDSLRVALDLSSTGTQYPVNERWGITLAEGRPPSYLVGGSEVFIPLDLT